MEQTRQIYEGWAKVDNTPIEDLEGYILRTLATRNDISIYIGTDALTRIEAEWDEYDNKKVKSRTQYLTVICFHMGRNGCHVIKRKDEDVAFGKRPPTEIAEKLNGEINRTAALALWMREKGFETKIKDLEVHMDLSPDESNGSFHVYKYIKGYFESLGFNALYKPDSPASSFAADYFL